MNLNLEILQEINQIQTILDTDLSYAEFYQARIEQLQSMYFNNNKCLFDKINKKEYFVANMDNFNTEDFLTPDQLELLNKLFEEEEE